MSKNKYYEKEKEHIKELKKQGICIRCRKNKAKKGCVSCQECLNKKNAVTKSRRKAKMNPMTIINQHCKSCHNLNSPVVCSTCKLQSEKMSNYKKATNRRIDIENDLEQNILHGINNWM